MVIPRTEVRTSGQSDHRFTLQDVDSGDSADLQPVSRPGFHHTYNNRGCTRDDDSPGYAELMAMEEGNPWRSERCSHGSA